MTNPKKRLANNGLNSFIGYGIKADKSVVKGIATRPFFFIMGNTWESLYCTGREPKDIDVLKRIAKGRQVQEHIP